MHEWAFHIVFVWVVGLIAALLVYTVLTPSTASRTMAVDALTMVLVAALATVAMSRAEAGFLDVALVLAMLGFVQTVGVVRLIAGRSDMR